ncbi:SLAC1 anion channel family protein [uncultured Maritimibacter sp.]|uniref:SLAC1 anion channel family protein n=1 Tax=uncultured Maritimibacter sp. TaxID=991866 RepID=UPI0026259310|nr:SLAC1 anion channel family protein [uncultured Maritimibacter sp.]
MHRLEYFPVTFFAVVMGLMGLALALHGAAPFSPWLEDLSQVVFWIALGVFAVIAALFASKLATHFTAVRAEWNHPLKLAFFPTITISLLLASTALLNLAPHVAEGMWLVGVFGQGVLSIAVVSGWISHRSFEVGHLTPAWFLPAVGNVIVPVAGARMGYLETSWLFFAGGMMLWAVLLTMVMNRLVFHDPIPARLFPTIVILIAPPSVAFVSYVGLVGHVDGFARALIYMGYIFAALVPTQMTRLARLPFALSWWVLSFPLAALAVASFLFARLEGTLVHQTVGFFVLLLLVLVVAGLVVRTILGLLRGEILQPE